MKHPYRIQWNKISIYLSLVLFSTMMVLAESTYDCQTTAPTCPNEGERCGPGLSGYFNLTNQRSAFWYSCNGRGDCGNGLPATGQCNVYSKVWVLLADLTCSATSDYGVCIVDPVGTPISMNRRCDTGGPCFGETAEELPILDPGYSGGTGHADTVFSTPVLPTPPHED